MIKFPKDFAWGVAAASYQIEGAALTDGRKPSVWDTFCRKPGAVKNGDCGNVGPDHYHHWREDVNLMNEIGVNAYRLSLAWPRIIPDGIGKQNPEGIAFYDRLIDELLEKGIEPWITLFHWDYPNELFLKGGWLNPDSSDWFAEYTRLVIDLYSDRVTHWVTLNEPQCFIHYGHQTGIHAPGLKLEISDVLKASHNVLLAHGKAVQTVWASARKPFKIGIAQASIFSVPETESVEDIEAAKKATFSILKRDTWNTSWWADPIILGHYPEDGLRIMHDSMPIILDKDMDIIHQPIDFYGVNVYSADRVRADGNHWQKVEPESDVLCTAMGWTIVPESIYWGPKFIYEHYKIPIVITENGMANNDEVGTDGKIHDPQRIDYMRKHLQELGKVIRENLPVQGYFYWSIMDNFEWAEGFDKRFGLVYVDYQTGKRIPKDSFEWYRNFIRNSRRKSSGNSSERCFKTI